ncbi:MAG: shikimate kinase [Bryobacteraceae bacterium]|jgi:shikimate kinase
MILKLKRTPGIYLVGFMAAGKSTIGRLLAHEMGWSFADLDEDIEAAVGVSIAEIFDQRGEEEFRRIEHEALRRRVRSIEQGRPTVVALGGGSFAEERNRAILVESGVTIWLDCPFPLICDRLEGSSHRPLARDRDRSRQLYEDRLPYYSQAEYRIEIDSNDPAEIVTAILKLPVF